MFKVNVKWGKQTFKDVECDTAGDALTFKACLYGMSNVPVDKQKVMIKGKVLKDTDDLTKFAIKNGMTLMMMGTAEEQGLREPAQPVQFLEDLTPAQRARLLHEKAAIIVPAGLENLGNTCYMNSVVQCLKRVNELKSALKEMRPPTDSNQMDPNMLMTLAGGQMMRDMESKEFSYPPIGFVRALRTAYPIFDEVEERSGHHKQQDADEALISILQAWRGPLQQGNEDRQDVIGSLFELEMKTKYTNKEDPTETSEQTENVFKLTCQIENGPKVINSLQEGLRVSLDGDIEKRSANLGRDAVWDKTSRVNRLPKYLCVNFVRFYWKQASAVGGTDAGKAKILRNVAFPKVFDMFEFCTDELKQSLIQGRELETSKRAAEDEARLSGKLEEEKKPQAAQGGDVEMNGEEETKEEAQAKKLVGAAAKAAQMEEEIKEHDKLLYRPFDSGLDTGNYQLIGVVTHKGRSADGGHYIGWVHASGDDWLQCDDDIVTVVKTDDILALRGGGDWHTAYLCFYRKIEVTPVGV